MSAADLPRTIAHGPHILKHPPRPERLSRISPFDFSGGKYAFCPRSEPASQRESRGGIHGSEWKIDGQIIIVARGKR